MRRLNHDQATALRATPGATVALFLTDRCPVGCAHCSVASLPTSPTITDWPLFTELLEGLCQIDSLRAVAITGGEPFAERRGLIRAVERLHRAELAVVLFTSGHWARTRTPPWIQDVLAMTSTVYLSLDTFHAKALHTGSPQEAVQAVTAAGCHLVLQVLDEPGMAEKARELCPTADINLTRPLTAGRGAAVFAAPALRPADGFGRCPLLNSPTVRYDGTITACCDEAVIMGRGPAGLRRRVTGREQVAEALTGFGHDPALRVIGRYGPAAARSVLQGRYSSICQSCWALQDAVRQDPAAMALATVLGSR